jgi:hypothetical protein
VTAYKINVVGQQAHLQLFSSRVVKVNRYLVLASALLLAACVGPTRYHPRTQDGEGYSQVQLKPNQYEVSYTANSLTRRTKVKQFLLYRAAEIAMETHHDNYIVLDKDSELSDLPLSREEPGLRYRHHDFEHHHLWFGKGISSEEFETSTLSFSPTELYTASIMILVYSHADQSSTTGKPFNARDIIELLGPSVSRPR